MINIFRKVRKKLANENKFFKYSRYAVGEILLIVVGIFFALQLQNWNENKKQKTQFKLAIEQIYNSINTDLNYFETEIFFLEDKIENGNTFINYPDSIPNKWLHISLYFQAHKTDKYNSQVNYHLNNLKYNSNDLQQNYLAKEITNYVNDINSINDYTDDNHILSFFYENNIAIPKANLNDVIQVFDNSDSTYYSKKDITKLAELIRAKDFNSLMKSEVSLLSFNLISFRRYLSDCQSILKLIKNYYPDIKLSFEEVGIIGTSIDGYDDVGAKSTPMLKTNIENNIWEIDLFLKAGTVKFRCRDSWTQNWGGETFPKGITLFDVPSNIPIPEAGNYHIILNLSANTYEFIKLEE